MTHLALARSVAALPYFDPENRYLITSKAEGQHMDVKPRVTITAKQRAELLRYWQAAAELRAKTSEIDKQICMALGLEDAGNTIAELEAGSTSVADFDMALAADGVSVA